MEPDELEEGLRWAYAQVYPGKDLLIDDPKALHKSYRLSELSRLLLELWRKDGNRDGSPRSIKAILGDAILDTSLRRSLQDGSGDLLNGNAYHLGADEIALVTRIAATAAPQQLFSMELELPPEVLQGYRALGLLQ
jgi:hypothetical protein